MFQTRSLPQRLAQTGAATTTHLALNRWAPPWWMTVIIGLAGVGVAATAADPWAQALGTGVALGTATSSAHRLLTAPRRSALPA